jgi:hypothetical protein
MHVPPHTQTQTHSHTHSQELGLGGELPHGLCGEVAGQHGQVLGRVRIVPRAVIVNCVCMYVCVCVCVYVYVCVRVCIYMHICVYMCVCVCFRVIVRVCVCVGRGGDGGVGVGQ